MTPRETSSGSHTFRHRARGRCTDVLDGTVGVLVAWLGPMRSATLRVEHGQSTDALIWRTSGNLRRMRQQDNALPAR